MTLKKIGLTILAVIILLIVVYLEGNGFEIHRLVVSLIGNIEGIVFSRVFRNFDKIAETKKWSTSKRLGRSTIIGSGLIIIMVAIDRLISYILDFYQLEYNILWTIIIPGTIVITHFFKSLDLWSSENENKDKLHGT